PFQPRARAEKLPLYRGQGRERRIPPPAFRFADGTRPGPGLPAGKGGKSRVERFGNALRLFPYAQRFGPLGHTHGKYRGPRYASPEPGRHLVALGPESG